MSNRYDGTYSEDWLLDGSPSTFRAQNIRPIDCNSDTAALATGVMTAVAVPVQPGVYVSNITFKSGATAADTPTHWFFALYDATGAKLAQSADQTTGSWAANTVKTLALTTPQRISDATVLYAVCAVTATAPPTLIGRTLGVAGAAASILSSKVLAQTSGTAVAGTAPATLASPTTVATIPLAILT